MAELFHPGSWRPEPEFAVKEPAPTTLELALKRRYPVEGMSREDAFESYGFEEGWAAALAVRHAEIS